MTSLQREQLATLVHSLRPTWGIAGIAAALHEATDQGNSFDLATAAIRAAADPSNRTPAIIAMNGPHWLGLAHKTPRVPTGLLCDICNRPRPLCEQVAQRTGDDHSFTPRAAQ